MIPNPGFELADGDDLHTPRDWVIESQGAGEVSVAFEGDDYPWLSAYESFDSGWGRDGSSQRFVTDLDGDDLNDLQRLPAETMSFWSVNQSIIALGALEAATFNEATTTTETFAGWDSSQIVFEPELNSSNWMSLPVENFEWAFIGFGMMGDVASATFNSTSDLREAFNVREPQIVHAQSSRFRTTSGAAYVGAQDDVVTFRTTGELPDEVSEGVSYYVFLVEGAFITVSRTPRNSNGTALVINDSGTGVHRIVGDPARYWIDVMP